MRSFYLKLIFLIIFLLIPVFLGQQISSSQTGDVTLNFFYGQGCPHCTKAKPFLDKLETKYPGLAVNRYEVWYDQENKMLFQKTAEEYNTAPEGVPAFFIEKDFLTGYGSDETTGKQIEDLVKQYLN